MIVLKFLAFITIVLGFNAVGVRIDRADAERAALTDAEVLHTLAPVCGRGQPINQDGQYLCQYTNRDGESVVRAIFDNPIKGVM